MQLTCARCCSTTIRAANSASSTSETTTGAVETSKERSTFPGTNSWTNSTGCTNNYRRKMSSRLCFTAQRVRKEVLGRPGPSRSFDPLESLSLCGSRPMARRCMRLAFLFSKEDLKDSLIICNGVATIRSALRPKAAQHKTSSPPNRSNDWWRTFKSRSGANSIEPQKARAATSIPELNFMLVIC